MKSHHSQSYRRAGFSPAFTLIELLIVVAIIAILAAIAIPNFIEAQVRAKVAHAQGEMHHLNIALETYVIDFGIYPPWLQDLITLDWLPQKERLIPLTTPVAYLSTVPDDPFQENTPYIGRQYDGGYDYVQAETFGEMACARGWDEYHPSWTSPSYRWGWRLFSFGPDLSLNHYIGTMGMTDPDYDASNGTISIGNIYRYGPGNVQFIWQAEPCLVRNGPCGVGPDCP